MKICIAGGRDFADYDVLVEVVDQILTKISEPIIIISGKAKGADSLGERYAREHDIEVLLFPADWKRHGKGAGPIRNAQMAEAADMLIAFWDGSSKGTKNMIGQMQKQKKPFKVFDYKGKCCWCCPMSDSDFKINEPTKYCNHCGQEFSRQEMKWTQDCQGIDYRLVCRKCYDRLMAKGYDGEFYDGRDETIEPED